MKIEHREVNHLSKHIGGKGGLDPFLVQGKEKLGNVRCRRQIQGRCAGEDCGSFTAEFEEIVNLYKIAS